MNQFFNRTLIGDDFVYTKLKEFLNENDITQGKSELENNYRQNIKEWSVEKNSQWVLRNYLAIKMVMSSTLMLTSLEYCINRNIRITEPYLIYYAILTAARAVVYTNPSTEWNDAKIIELTHSKIINITCDSISRFNKLKSKKIKKIILWAKDHRELFSYKFPANGIPNETVSYQTTVEICTFLVELAQFQSEILEKQNFKKNINITEIDRSILEKGYVYNLNFERLIDKEDWYQLDYIVRKQPYPVNLYYMLSEGMVEDFFDPWYPIDYDVENKYNPDINSSLIFPLP